MKIDLNVNVHHLTRIEGHGDIKVKVRGGEVEQADWEVVETPRYFEPMLKGKHYTTAALLTSRICGICSISHCLTSLEAIEDAFGVTITEAAAKLRYLAKHGETLQSHYLHMFFLAAPDFLGAPSVLPLVASHRDVVDVARRLKGLGNRICDLVAGRTTHPVSLHVGGVSAVPPVNGLLAFRDELKRSLDDLRITQKVLGTFKIPDFARETEFVSLKGETDYPYIGRKMISTDGVERARRQYREMTNEYVDARNTSKWAKLSRDTLAVGPLARFNNNAHLLHPEAREVADSFGLKPVCHNPFMATVARLVECFHSTHEAIRLIDELSEPGAMDHTMEEVQPIAGEGVGAVEAPRGILYHYYQFDDEGRVVKADCVIPTTQNNANIHRDLMPLVKQFSQAGMTDKELELLCSMLVRSYDPCVSCSVH